MEVIEALIERGYVNEDELRSRQYTIGEIHSTSYEDIRMLGVVIKIHIDDKPINDDIRRALNNLRKICEIKKIESIAIITDLVLIPLTGWTYFTEMCNEIFKGSEINVALLQNNILIPCVEKRYKIIREYQETTVGGHRGMNKTYNKTTKDFYWKNMRPEVQQFVKG
jgi:hypothetical protein